MDKDLDGVHKFCFSSVMKCDFDIRRELFQNITLAGGSTLFEGFPERMWHEVNILAQKLDKNYEVKVLAPKERKYSVWLGGSVLASLDTFNTMWVSKADYEENGAKIIHQRCF